jgi:hypothetical protein
MPQPLRPPYQLNIDPETLNERPELAAQIGIIAALWSRVEMWLGILMGDLLGAEARYGLAMYYAIVSLRTCWARIASVCCAVSRRPALPQGVDREACLRKTRNPSKAAICRY